MIFGLSKSDVEFIRKLEERVSYLEMRCSALDEALQKKQNKRFVYRILPFGNEHTAPLEVAVKALLRHCGLRYRETEAKAEFVGDEPPRTVSFARYESKGGKKKK